MHWIHHVEPGLYILVLIFIVYRPPRASTGLGDFIERHLGDSVGFYILHLGILLVVISGVYPQVGGVGQTGQSLILAGMVALKLTKTAPAENPPPAPGAAPPAAPASPAAN